MVKKVLTAEEVASFLGLNRSTIYKKARNGKIPAVRIEGVWRFYRDSLEQWLKVKSLESYQGSIDFLSGGVDTVNFKDFKLGIKSGISRADITL
jgi:excisionase family DNA binding protein